MTSRGQKADRLLIISPRAGSMNESIEARLREEYSDHAIIEFDPKVDFEKLIKPDARVVVAGGDGTIEFVVRKLADTKHPVGILPMGTYNNLAHALHLPTELGHAIEVTRKGRPTSITLGRVNGHVFIEACAVGLFGDAIVLGESAKDLAFGGLAEKLRHVIQAKPFHYELNRDLNGQGTAMSLVFSNTASIGSKLPVSDASPTDPYLEFSADAGRTRGDIVGRVIASAVGREPPEEPPDLLLRFRTLDIKTRPRARVYADNKLVGRTPATVTAEVSAVKVMLPPDGDRK
ncbi:MAG TPA: diacylglycerol kinase family protein [Candidatus Udaeobacter sp.]|nr:diacylglycerol kinase family protein [Candidatus Udaeobacter sp.]